MVMTDIEACQSTHVVNVSEPAVAYKEIEGYPGKVVATDYHVTVSVQPPIEGDAYNTIAAAAEAGWQRKGALANSGVKIHYLGRQALDRVTGLPVETSEAADPDKPADRGDVARLSVYRMDDASLAGYLGRFSAELVRLADMPDEERPYQYPPILVGRPR
jgi:hypothetical protein